MMAKSATPWRSAQPCGLIAPYSAGSGGFFGLRVMMQPTGMIAINPTTTSHSATFVSIPNLAHGAAARSSARRCLLGHPPQNNKFGCECCLPKASSLPLICRTSAGSASSSSDQLITIQRRHIEERRSSSR
jgi:hypothetical protein